MYSDRVDNGKTGNFARMFCGVSIAVMAGAILHNALFNQKSRVLSQSGITISGDSTRLDKLFSVVNIAPDSSSSGRTRMTVEPQDAAEPAAEAADNPDVLIVQRELKRVGLYTGPVDGVFGERTGLAIRLYQRKNGLQETGQPDQALIDHLNYVRHIEQAATITGTIAEEPDADTISRIQRELLRLGYDAGPADGKIGQRTRQAVKAFQTDAGMTITGSLSPELVDRLLKRSTVN